MCDFGFSDKKNFIYLQQRNSNFIVHTQRGTDKYAKQYIVQFIIYVWFAQERKTAI